MVWYIMAGILVVLAAALLVLNYIRDRRYLKRRTSETMNPDLWKEIEEERDALFERHKRFQDALKMARDKTVDNEPQ